MTSKPASANTKGDKPANEDGEKSRMRQHQSGGARPKDTHKEPLDGHFHGQRRGTNPYQAGSQAKSGSDASAVKSTRGRYVNTEMGQARRRFRSPDHDQVPRDFGKSFAREKVQEAGLVRLSEQLDAGPTRLAKQLDGFERIDVTSRRKREPGSCADVQINAESANSISGPSLDDNPGNRSRRVSQAPDQQNSGIHLVMFRRGNGNIGFCKIGCSLNKTVSRKIRVWPIWPGSSGSYQLSKHLTKLACARETSLWFVITATDEDSWLKQCGEMISRRRQHLPQYDTVDDNGLGIRLLLKQGLTKNALPSRFRNIEHVNFPPISTLTRTTVTELHRQMDTLRHF